MCKRTNVHYICTVNINPNSESKLASKARLLTWLALKDINSKKNKCVKYLTLYNLMRFKTQPGETTVA